jgi:protein involved in polysaccharide export with SLBB domain
MLPKCRSAFHKLSLTILLLPLTMLPAFAQEIGQGALLGQHQSATCVTVIGSVKQPISLSWRPDLHLLEVLADCGGPSLAPENAKAILLTHDGKTRTEINLSALLGENDQKQNMSLQPGDVMWIEPKDAGEVYVSGAVLHPGTHPVTKQGITASDLLAEMGGSTPEGALSHAQIVHGTQILTRDLRPMLSGKAHDDRLVAGDLLLIPNVGTVNVQGAVVKPDYYLLRDGEPLTVADALTLAGGPNSDADLARIVIARCQPNKPTENIQARLDDVLLAGDALIVPLDTHAGKVKPWPIVGTAQE